MPVPPDNFSKLTMPSRLPELVHQKIWTWLLVHHAPSTLISRAADAARVLKVEQNAKRSSAR
jgi:hypothetical protein